MTVHALPTLPTNRWPSVELSEATSLLTDGTHYTPPDVGKGIPFLTVRDVSDDGLDFQNCSKISQIEYDAANRQNSAPRCGDVLFSKDGTVGKVHLVREDQPFAVLSSLAILRPTKHIDGAYLAHFLRTSSTIDAASKKKTGSAIRRIILRDLATLRIPLPPLEVQRRIAAILDKANELRRKRRQSLTLVDSLTQSTFSNLFQHSSDELLRWGKPVALADLATISSGITKGRKLNGQETRKVPYLAVANVQDRRLSLSNVKTIEATEDEIQRFRLKTGDLLLTEGGDPDKLGRGTLWAGEIGEAIHQNHIFKVRLTSDRVLPLFLNWLVSSPYGKRYFLSVAKQTTGIASINKTQLSEFPVIVPPIDLQHRFVSLADAAALETKRLVTSMSSFESLFSSLQFRAFSGQL